MRALLAPDKFKGTLSAAQVADAIAVGLETAGVEVDRCPIADGGEGTAEVLVGALGGEWREAEASDPLGRRVGCRFALLDGGATAVVEVAEASGLWRLTDGERDPIDATSVGTGELIAAALGNGARRVLLACGGSATTDGGSGALSAFDPDAAEIVCLCDTDVGFVEAASVYGPQKGADASEVAELEDRLRGLADSLPHDPSRLPFTGAAGGFAGGLWAHGARLVSGAAHVLATVGFDSRMARSHLVVTGEGRLDATSLRGKAVGEVIRRSRRAGIPCHAVVGGDDLGPEASESAGLASVSLGTSEAELRDAGRRLSQR